MKSFLRNAWTLEAILKFARPSITSNNSPFTARFNLGVKSSAGVAIFNPCNQQVDSLRSYTANTGINSAGKFNYRSPRWQVLENQLSETIYRILGVPCGFPERETEPRAVCRPRLWLYSKCEPVTIHTGRHRGPAYRSIVARIFGP